MVEGHLLFGPKAPAQSLCKTPVLTGSPPPSFLRMTVARPACEAQIQHVIQLLEDGLTDDGTIVLTPACDHRIELPDQIFLAGPAWLFRMTSQRCAWWRLMASRLGLMRVLKPRLAL